MPPSLLMNQRKSTRRYVVFPGESILIPHYFFLRVCTNGRCFCALHAAVHTTKISTVKDFCFVTSGRKYPQEDPRTRANTFGDKVLPRSALSLSRRIWFHKSFLELIILFLAGTKPRFSHNNSLYKLTKTVLFSHFVFPSGSWPWKDHFLRYTFPPRISAAKFVEISVLAHHSFQYFGFAHLSHTASQNWWEDSHQSTYLQRILFAGMKSCHVVWHDWHFLTRRKDRILKREES